MEARIQMSSISLVPIKILALNLHTYYPIH